MTELAINNAQIEDAEARLLDLPQVDCPVTHRFAPGVYMREVFMPAGTFVIGHCHKTAHLNCAVTGKAIVMMNGDFKEVVAPSTFMSEPGVRKVLYIVEPMIWQTIHPTDRTDLDELENELIVKSDSFTAHQQMKDLETLKLIVEGETP